MILDQVKRRGIVSLLRPAVLLATGAALGVWLGVASRDGTQLFLAAVAFVLTLVFAVGWQFRAQVRQRWHGVWNSYAEREIAQARRRETLLRR